jgi:hypothetical protein
LVLAALTLCLASCGGGGGGGDNSNNNVNVEPAIGPIPAAEFATVAPPTYEAAVAAFKAVTAANPALLNDEPALSRAFFDEVRRSTSGGGTAPPPQPPTQAPTRDALFDLSARMTQEEWKLAIRAPIASAAAATTIEPSARAAREQMPCDADLGFADGKADALRHAYWNALMTRRTGAAFAAQLAAAHEIGSTNTAAASAMDLHNNARGRALAERYPAASDAQWLEMLLQERYVLVTGAIPAGESRLVTIDARAQRPYDGRFGGTLSYPASGAAPWALELDLAQCGAVLHGRLVAQRGTASIERRFSGTLDAARGALALTVVDPLPFEPAAALEPCLAMQVVLSGNERRLDGTWSSSSCASGGTMSLAR